MPLIRFEAEKEEGFHLLITSGEVGWFPDHVYGVTEFLLRQLDPVFQEKGVCYHRLTQEEADQLVKSGKNGKASR